MKTCEEYASLISDFLDGELSAEDRAKVAEHLASCPSCQRYFDDLVAMHDAFDQIEEDPVPDGFAEQVMARVRETPRTEEKKIIPFPRWRRWAALAACCAIAALGLWSTQRTAMPQKVSQSALAESAPSMARDTAPEEIITADDAPVSLMMDEDGGVFPRKAPESPPEESSAEAQKQSREVSGSTSGSLPEMEEDVVEAEADTDYSRDGAEMPEPAMAVPAPAAIDQGEPLPGSEVADADVIVGGGNGPLTMEQAKSMALAREGIDAADAVFTKAKLERDDGRQIYDLEFCANDYEYEYEIDANTGEVLSLEISAGTPLGAAGSVISRDRAQEIALAKVPGAAADHIRKLKLDRDDGRQIYEVEILYDGTEYELDIDAVSGAVLKFEAESINKR